MKKYKINKEQDQELSDQEISQYKDFGKLRANYDAITKRSVKPLYKRPIYFFILILVILLLFLILGEL